MPNPILLDGQYEVEFVPFVDQLRLTELVLQTFVVEQGRQILVDSSHPYFRMSPALTGEHRAAALKDYPVRVDLSQFEGRSVSLQWRFQNAKGRPRQAAIGSFKLFRKDRSRQGLPHILFICSDTHRFDYALGADGPDLMPGLHELCVRSVVYTSAYSNSSWTVPSVTSSLTGLFPRFHGTGENLKGRKPDKKLTLGEFKTLGVRKHRLLRAYPPQLTTLVERLNQVGYRTGMVISNPYLIVSGLVFDDPDVLYDTGIVPGNLVNDAASLVVDVLGKEQPLFLFVHYMDVHQYHRWFLDTHYPGAPSQEYEDTRIPR